MSEILPRGRGRCCPHESRFSGIAAAVFGVTLCHVWPEILHYQNPLVEVCNVRGESLCVFGNLILLGSCITVLLECRQWTFFSTDLSPEILLFSGFQTAIRIQKT